MKEHSVVKNVECEPLMPRVFINGFPKSGTHLAYLMVAHLAQAQEPKHQMGSFLGNCWTNRWSNVPMMVDILKNQPAGTWIMGHLGYREELATALQETGTCMVFVYRDLRDVAVSQAYHIESDDDTFKHPGKKLFMDLPSHEARLKAVIEGYDRYPGLIERWEKYAPWLDVDWVVPIKFEEIRTDPQGVAEKVVPYVIKRTLERQEQQPIVLKENYEAAIQRAVYLLGTTDHSSTYRKGEIGGWQEEFTPAIRRIFNEHNNGWLERLGYKPEAVTVEAQVGSLGAIPQGIGG